jgi:trimeric autotransporter adhesin
MRQSSNRGALFVLCALLSLTLTAQLWAVIVPEGDSAVHTKVYRHPDLSISNLYQPATRSQSAAMQQRLSALGMSPEGAHVDLRSGRFGTLITSVPMIPGSGAGNQLGWQKAAPRDEAGLKVAAWDAFENYLRGNLAALNIDPSEIGSGRKVTVARQGDLISIYAPRTVGGVPVRDSYVTMVINHGNMVLMGSHNWGDVRLSPVPNLTVDAAREVLRRHLDAVAFTAEWKKPHLVIVPTAQGDVRKITEGEGFNYRLAWAVAPRIDGDFGSWEGLIDAHNGELIAFEDTNHYATTRQVVGGVVPISNDGVVPDGIEQLGWPMPNANLGGGLFTNSEGDLQSCVDGNVTSTLSGTFVSMSDNCGAISLTSAGNIDFGASGGSDCTTPGFGGAGNTHASRSGFYELNRIKQLASSQLPNNEWLKGQLTANMNINQTCNAFWGNGGTVNFYRSGGGCGNTGEIAGVFDHEWGHGMDNNDAVPSISSPGEGIADVYAALRLNTSCIGRNFRLGNNCGGYGDPCTQCDGVRDIDKDNRASGQPHDLQWTDANCGSGSSTPCGGSTHCEGATYSEAVWNLYTDDLQGGAFNLDANTALEVAQYLTYNGAGNVGAWYQCSNDGQGNGDGCNGDGGYLNYLAADDDNGNLNDGTPHMTAIFAAFDRQGIACATPTVQNSGCAGTPATAPTVNASVSDRTVNLSWNAVSGASGYQVYRTDGVFACAFGKIKIGETTGTSFTDDQLLNGHGYSYVVIPMGAGPSCFGRASSCVSATPTAGANFAFGASSVAIQGGDGDGFVDNCETGTVSFDVTNIGNGSLTNLRIASITASHPGLTITTALPATINPSLAACGADQASFSFDATNAGLAFGDTIVFDVEVTSDELGANGKTTTISIANAESDFSLVASRSYTFESGLDSWQVINGTFTQTSPGGANGTAGHLRSSNAQPDACDHIRSPEVSLTATSTLSLYNQHDIEGFFAQGQVWYDRANLGLYNTADGSRTVVSPSGGRTYNASGPNGSCGTTGQAGWADTAASWAQSSWSSAALQAGAFAGELVQLDLRYGTDGLEQGFGFWFDEVVLTNFNELVPDAQNDSCVNNCGNGVIDAGEVCDGGLLGGESCGTQGCSAGGTLACNASCTGFDTSGCFGCTVCGDGVCESGEDCNSCATDCIGGTTTGAVCGNGICEAGDGEDCVTCAADCNGAQGGKPANRFCCGNGGSNPVGCGDSRCTTGGFSCTTVPVPSGSFCCGDLVCEGDESSANCSLDCGACDLFETSCTDGVDNDCDLFTDCDDSDCDLDAACQTGCTLGQPGDACVDGADCCSGNCKGKAGAKTCK